MANEPRTRAHEHDLDERRPIAKAMEEDVENCPPCTAPAGPAQRKPSAVRTSTAAHLAGGHAVRVPKVPCPQWWASDAGGSIYRCLRHAAHLRDRGGSAQTTVQSVSQSQFIVPRLCRGSRNLHRTLARTLNRQEELNSEKCFPTAELDSRSPASPVDTDSALVYFPSLANTSIRLTDGANQYMTPQTD